MCVRRQLGLNKRDVRQQLDRVDAQPGGQERSLEEQGHNESDNEGGSKECLKDSSNTLHTLSRRLIN